ncbi:tubulointerstitial nephritis antigen-like [Pectinophora gossypiella]|uniref:tubulointerstitial nephritis antigen-like n=1 Tax=Pectinophora gossypiella TaxID=13191 RepID=UPI00214F533B|nr:tubulointerstitial nephritis antigen-like [Pectinophora gossypiella]
MANILYFIASCALLCLVAAYHGADLPPGPYCGKFNQCCVNREDDCSHQILDTLCYCDEHCNRTHDDCCPDYEEVCLGIAPPPKDEDIPAANLVRACYPGQTKTDKCNKCTCQSLSSEETVWSCEQDDCIIDDEIITLVNQGSSWRAANYTQFYSKKLKEGIVYKLGTLPLSRETQRMGAIHYDKDISYPPHFDARNRWPSYISPVVDQGWCGSDWAVAVAGVASDRFAIQSNGAESMVLSPQTLLSCDVRGQLGCDGGYIDSAWLFVGMHGLVDEQCFPYKGMKTPCPFKRRGNLISDGCRPVVQKRTSRYKVGPPGKLTAEKDIMYDIMESGPVHAIMTVFQDFFHYRSGVYRHIPIGNEQYQGLHSVRIVGWGEERGDKYWIVANSWGEQWGEDGYFRIAKGSNESGIESFVITVLAEVTEAYD